MRHTYECPMRWADLDMLGHVNNVALVDYLQEARIEALATMRSFEGPIDGAEGLVVVRAEVEFARPLLFRGGGVLIDVWVSAIRAGSCTMSYEIFDVVDGDRVVYATAATMLAPVLFSEGRPRRFRTEERSLLEQLFEETPTRDRIPLRGTSTQRYPLRVRWSDVDAYRHVNNAKYFEFLQESRIAYFLELGLAGRGDALVVARMDLDYRRQLEFRRRAYQTATWVSELGNRSFVLAQSIHDGDELLAQGQTVMVCFDPTTQRSAPMSAEQRDRLAATMSLDQAE